MNKKPIFKAFALLLFIGGIFGLVTCKHSRAQRTARHSQNGPAKHKERMHSSKSMPFADFNADMDVFDSIRKDNQTIDREALVTPDNLDSITKTSPFVRPALQHTPSEIKRAKQLKQRIHSSKSFVISLDEEDIRLLASFDFKYAFGLKSHAQNLLEQLTMRRTKMNDKTREQQLIDSLKNVIEKENWKPIKKDSVSRQEDKK